MPARLLSAVIVCGLLLSGGELISLADDATFPAEQIEYFEKEVRPLLIEHCQKCHGGEQQKGKLRLDTRESVLAGGETGPGIIPGRPDESELIKALRYSPDGYQMPPDGKLPDPVIEKFVRWVEWGAPWPVTTSIPSDRLAPTDEAEFSKRAERWSFQPLNSGSPPEVLNSHWPRNAIDRFILAKLEAAGYSPAEEADRRTWIRRAYFDTLGLPPPVDVVEAFVADSSPEAWDRIVDQLLASPHFGERWGRHWLDLVRYAESRGHEFDHDVPNPWHYRDYVIRAINDDVPYDQYVVEHVAGDLLKKREVVGQRTGDEGQGARSVSQDTRLVTHEPRRSNMPYLARYSPAGADESILATGFWYLGEWIHSPVDIRKDETERFDNMLDVYGKCFLGLTVACARCHDHKFDPISQKDYYALAGYLKSTSYAQRPFESLNINLRLQSQLTELSARAEPAIENVTRAAVKPALQQVNHLLLATREILAGQIASGVTTDFDDFEQGTYEGWELTGDAFGLSPQSQDSIARIQGDVHAHGTRFINSHQVRDGGRGDDHVGTMTSREFVVAHEKVDFLIGGGPHPGKTCMNLLVDGQVVLTSTGHASNQMRQESWDMRPYRGRVARFQIVDQERGGWGNIGIDHIVFRNTPHWSIDDAQLLTRMDELAERRGLDRQLLKAWVGHTIKAADDPADPLHGWAVFAVGKSDKLPAPVQRSVTMPESAQLIPLIGQDGAYYSFPSSSQSPRIWLSDNPEHPVSYSEPSSQAIVVDPDLSNTQERPGTMRDAGALAGVGRAGHTLRTASFTVTTGHIAAWVRGGCATYVVVDSHALILGPLHGELVRKHQPSPQWHWIEHDVSRYQGHVAHVEIVAADGTDFACESAYQVEVAPPDRQSATSLCVTNINPEKHLAPAALDWILSHPGLFGIDTEEFRRQIGDVSRPYIDERRRLLGQLVRETSAAPAMLDGSGSDAFLLVRGNSNKPSTIVPRRFIEVFHGAGPHEQGTGSGRLDLARQMVNPEQTPVLSRVIVNRLWHHYYGRGIVATPDDFGHMGQLPTHPELLDWLANELIRNEWSLKHIHRLILLSTTYRMSSDEAEGSLMVHGYGAQKKPHVEDPHNLLLHRMNIKRLEGEIVRDSLLQLSGRLDDRLYGPSVPIALTPFQEGRGRPEAVGPIDGRGRRSVYLSVRRNFMDSFLTVFDLPNPHTSVGRRSVSNVPAQALAMLNSPLVLEQTQRMAEEFLRSTVGETDEKKLQILYQRLFSRRPSEEETASALSFIVDSGSDQSVGTNSTKAWTELCHVLCNTKEFIYIQ